ncbi:MAG: TetR/AcrR family transcriptional regulator [Hyphomicrobiaceae bacterium]
MPRLTPDTQSQRREHILDAAERCFARAGFHRTTMQAICREAGISPGALYIYFDSKEALIAGLAERDRAAFQDRFAALGDATDVVEALRELANHYFVTEPAHKRLMCVEIGLEATRNPRVGEIHHAVDIHVRECFAALFQRLADEGRIRPVLDIPALVQVFVTIGDGLFWRRATDPAFDVGTVLPAALSVIRDLLNPVSAADAPKARRTRETTR